MVFCCWHELRKREIMYDNHNDNINKEVHCHAYTSSLFFVENNFLNTPLVAVCHFLIYTSSLFHAIEHFGRPHIIYCCAVCLLANIADIISTCNFGVLYFLYCFSKYLERYNISLLVYF